jgi:dTDP-4-amino-4,6-dideoxygalactose transaminase
MQSRKVPFLDLRVTDPAERSGLLAAVDAVLQHGRLVLGPEVEALESRFAAACGRQFAVGVHSGTDALFLALKALGLQAGDEVITTSMSWIATANAIAMTGATPIFADVADDLNMDPASVARLLSPRTKAVLIVHFNGRLCATDALQELTRSHRLLLVEDAAQAFAASNGAGKAGSFGILGCFSMNPMKVFAALGEAGMIVTDEPAVRDRLSALRYNGTVNREDCHTVSLNARLDTIQAAMLLRRMDRVEEAIEHRRALARRYHGGLRGLVSIPEEQPGCRDVFYTYTIRTPERDRLMTALAERGIETRIRHPLIMPEHTAYRPSARGEWTNARRLVKEIVSLPIHGAMGHDDVDYVVHCVRACLAGR